MTSPTTTIPTNTTGVAVTRREVRKGARVVVVTTDGLATTLRLKGWGAVKIEGGWMPNNWKFGEPTPYTWINLDRVVAVYLHSDQECRAEGKVAGRFMAGLWV